MKKVLLLLVVVLAVFTLASCKEDAKTLQMLWWSDGTEGDVMQTLLDDYLEETGITIELVPVAYNDYEARLATMVSGGEAPALARVTEGHLNNFKANILSLEGVYTTSGFTNLFYNADGDVISLPMDITANGMFVNTTLLDKYDVNYPELGDDVWTWAEFETEMLKLEAGMGVGDDDVAAPGVFDHQGHRNMTLLYQNGVKVWETPYTASNLKSAAAVEVIQQIRDWYDEGFLAPETYSTLNSANLFKTGQYGFHLSGNWNVSGYATGITTFDWAVVPMPYFENRATILGGKSLAAFANTGLEDEAKDFIAWMAEGTQHDAYTGGVPYLTPRLGATVNYGDFADQYAVFLDEIANTNAIYVQDWLNQVMIPGMYPLINDLFMDNADPTQTLSPLELLTALETDLKAAAPTS
ncbi:MAG: extracellular solute-binding protein [Acholeplasmataceae bacterium]|nr:extracellular solute-binding protein [Acholeplasmataceae bacterium]